MTKTVIYVQKCYFRPNVFNHYEQLPQNEKQKEEEESVNIEPQSILNDSVLSDSFSDIAEEKDDEYGPQDLSMICYHTQM